MPIFDFICSSCDNEFESLILKDDETVRCPRCGNDTVNRVTVSLFSCTGVQLTKMLKMDSEDRMKKGLAQMKKQRTRKDRIKIL